MEIKIGTEFVITSDSLQFILNTVKVGKKGKNEGQERYEAIGYYPTINQLVNGLIHHNIRNSSVTSIASLAAEIGRIANLCQEAFAACEAVAKA
ncbi:DUF5405 family protein [Serratia quinivorans]|uniref:DUF5405 family protein n=1 Tax=Serratia quinivorans TaxID=137545 RepID=UPI0021785ACE|nr:DUF5405 family protein [Serratia quinivorans]CAI0696013.1 Uncharacterised protein [Serratia quinivorans]CAI1571670.1 Uncharacterised protein [Serratia quinivorans]